MKRILNKILYKLLLWALFLAGIWPDWLLYNVLGRVLYVALYKVFGYRVAVVRENLKNSFPQKREAELRDIEKRYYRHLSEVFVDTIKMASISKRSITKRMTYRNIEAHEESLRGRSWFAAMSHFGSWELTINYAMFSDHRLLAVYRPLSSELFDRYYRHIRARFGTEPIPMHGILHEVISAKREGATPVSVAMIADQTPPVHEIKQWYTFLNQQTPFFSGIDKMARKYGMPVYFTYMRKVGARRYEADFQMIYDGEEQVGECEITERYVRRLEQMIEQNPHLWVWSHKRWKHKPQNER